MLDIGSGPLGFPDACPARVSLSVDPLHERYAQHGLLLRDSHAIHLSVGAERIRSSPAPSTSWLSATRSTT